MQHVIDYVEFAVDDLQEAKAFYAKALGWAFNDYGPDYAGIQDPMRPGQEFGGLEVGHGFSRWSELCRWDATGLLTDARNFLRTAPHLVNIPGAAIFLVVLSFNLLGNTLRDVMDPRLRGR